MKCPRCETTVLEEKDREGIGIDVCQQCRGIWLDRGELERLIARSMDQQDALETRFGVGAAAGPGPRQEPRYPHADREHDKHDKHHEQRGHDDHRFPDDRRYRKRSWLETLTDVFD